MITDNVDRQRMFKSHLLRGLAGIAVIIEGSIDDGLRFDEHELSQLSSSIDRLYLSWEKNSEIVANGEQPEPD